MMSSPEQSVAVEDGGDGSAQDKAQLEAMARLHDLGMALHKSRKDAIEGRAASGIEEEWRSVQDAYEGFDLANGGERGRGIAWTQKPPGQMPVSGDQPTRSTVFLNITRPYVDASAGRVADMLLPTDDRPWGIQPTPAPELVELANSTKVLTLPDGRPVDEAQLAKALIEKSNDAAEKAQTRIEDWLVECQWHAEVRKVINDAARLGTGILKGPVPKKVRKIAFDTSGPEPRVVLNEDIKPASVKVSPWNLFPDPLCGESIHNGNYVWELDEITAKGLRDLKGTPGYIDGQIDEVIKEGPQKPHVVEPEKMTTIDKTPFQIWYYTGTIEKVDLEAAGCECPHDMDGGISAVITMVNNRVIKAAMNPLDSGEFPYDVLPWQQRDGFWAGIGVGNQISVPQGGVNAATRNMNDNAGLSAGPQIILLQDVVTPVNGKWELTPRKFWYAKIEADLQDVQNAFIVINIPTMQVELMNIIQFYLKMAEDVTGLPMLLQGQQGKAPDTVGGMTMLQNNASAVLRRLARLFDDNITEPHIGRYYDWLLQYGEDKEEKGDFQIDARGSSVLVERDIQNQALINMHPMALKPAFRINPAKYAEELLKSQKIDPKRIQYTDEEWEALQKQKPPTDPRIEVAQINAGAKADENAKDRKHEAAIELLGAELQQLEQDGKKVMNIDKIRSVLAGKVMELNAQERISDKTNVARQVARPPSEPRGRAPRGQAFQR